MTRFRIPGGRLPRGQAAPRMLGLVALGVGLFMTLAGAYLGWNTMRANNALEGAASEAARQAEGIRSALGVIEQGLADPEVAAVARAEQRGEVERAALIEALRDAGIRNVLYLVNASEPLETTNLEALPGGGFAILNMLLEAGESGTSPAQAHFAGTPDEYLALARRLDPPPREDASDDQDADPAPLSVLWVALPMTVVTNQVERPDGIDGLVLRQPAAGDAIELLSLGTAVPASARSVEIPSTRFELAWQRSQVLGPMTGGQLGGLIGAGMLMLVLGGLLLNRSRLPAIALKPRRKPGDDVPAPAEPSPDADTIRRQNEAPVVEASEREDRSSTEDVGPSETPEAEAAPTPEDELGPMLDEMAAESESDDAASDDDGLTADGEPRREAASSQPLDAPELGGPAEESNDSDASAPEPAAEEPADEPAEAPDDEEPVDEQAEMGEMLRALTGDDEPADATAPTRPSTSTDPGRAAAPAPAVTVPDASIFRAYDIRGVVGETLDEAVAEAIGRAIGAEARERNLTRIAVARDGRLSGAQMLAALAKGLVASGLEVIEVGAVPTPVLYYAAQEIGGGSGVMVTGSHNPPDYNGFKIVLGGETLSGDAIRALHQRLADGKLTEGEGQLSEQRIRNQYIERIVTDIQLEKSVKVVVDCGNGIAGAVAPRLLESIGADVIPLYAEVDGSFPNHHPDPGDPKTLEDLRLCVRNFEAALGIAFDGDGDRLGVVGPDGEIIYPDRLMMLFARDVLSRNAGAEIIYDVKCTSLLAGEIEEAGGTPVMARTGHSFIKAEIKERGAPLAGEMSGHFFFGERWYGFDDGLYSAARLLEIIASDSRASGQIFADLPKAESTPELKVEMKEGEPHAFVESFATQAEFDGATLNTTDGVRADFEDGFGLVRASNTTPVLVLRFEGKDKDALARIQGAFRDAMLEVNPGLKLPF